MKRLVLVCGILASVVSVGMGAMSNDEWQRARHNCFENKDKSACQALINNGLPSVEQNLGSVYLDLQDYYNAKKYFEMGCNKGNGNVLFQAMSCHNLGLMYYEGKGVRQNYAKATELYKKACDMKSTYACNNLGVLYGNGEGVRQNLSTAKQYFGKACDLGDQMGCDNYKLLHSNGVQ